MLYNGSGGIEPPAGMVERLQQIDPHLDMVYGGASGAWWIVWRWPEHDPRRAWIRQGKRPAHRDFDMWCKLPADCNADQAYGYIVNHMVANRDHGDIGRMLNRVAAYNKQAANAVMAPERELAAELAEGMRIKTKAPRSGINRDGKRLKDFLHDAGFAVDA